MNETHAPNAPWKAAPRGLRGRGARITGWLLVAFLAHPVPSAPRGQPAHRCSHVTTVWESFGESRWTGRLLEIVGDRGRVREVVVWLEPPDVAPEDARWFVTGPLPPEPVHVAFSERTYAGDELEALCREVDSAGLGEIHAGKRRRAFRRGGRRHVRVPETAVATDVPGGRAGVRTRSFVEGEVTLHFSTARFDLAREETTGEDDGGRTVPEAAGAVLESARRILARHVEGLPPGRSGFAALPAARRLLSFLSRLDRKSVPPDLRSEFLLTRAVAPADYVSALATEAVARPGRARVVEAALRTLRASPSPESRDEIVALLRRATARGPDDRGFAPVALGALVATDPDTACLEALPFLLEESTEVRAALGVYAATEPELRRDLSTLNVTDTKALREAAARVLDHLSTSARNRTLRLAATALRDSTDVP